MSERLPRYALPALLVVSIAWYGLWGRTTEAFDTAANARNILTSQAALAVLALGLVVPFVAGHLDLSVGNVAGVASIATASSYADYGQPVWIGVLVGIVVGLVAGGLNGLLVVVLRVDSIVITLG